jgi:hypothetical protein
MRIKIVDDRWSADLLSSPSSHLEHIFHLTATINADTEKDALLGADAIMAMFARGRKAYIRVRPEVVTQKNFETGATEIRGYVRFSFSLEKGEWEYEVSNTSIGISWTDI